MEAVAPDQLKPWPATPDDLACWKRVKLHRHGYVVFEQAFHSAPLRLIGQSLWVRGGSQEVRLYTTRYELGATHPRALRPGARVTHPDHLPPEKLPGAPGDPRDVPDASGRGGPTTLRPECVLHFRWMIHWRHGMQSLPQ